MNRWPILSDHWSYDWALLLIGIEQVWRKTKDNKYFEYIESNINNFIKSDGNIRTYEVDEYNLDNLCAGKLLFTLYQITGQDRYRKGIDLLMTQVESQPRTREGGFWYQKILPHQMWLKSIYMLLPFYAQCASFFDKPNTFEDVAQQILLIDRHTRNPEVGLYFHAWDESTMQKWANPLTGCSSLFLGSAMGWYAMGIVDVLDYLPMSHQTRERIFTILQKLILTLVQTQDDESGLWRKFLSQEENNDNNPDQTASCMILYTMGKAIQKKYIEPGFVNVIRKGYSGIVEHFFELNEQGLINFKTKQFLETKQENQNTEKSIGSLSFEPCDSNEFTRLGAFLLCSLAFERMNHFVEDSYPH